MKHGSLFSGIGGFDLAAEWMGWKNVFHCEWKEFNQKILKYYWPNAKSYTDITKSDFTIYRGTIDILTGGFPCQPYSVAGKRKGTEDERHLWPEMLRAIREIRPRWIVGENVSGLVNWNGGLVFEEVQTDLENEGYQVQAFLLPACGVNAPHKRERIWFVAYSDSNRNRDIERQDRKENCVQELNRKTVCTRELIGAVTRDTTNTSNERLQRCKEYGGIKELRKERKEQSSRLLPSDWENFPTQSPLCYGDDGFPFKLDNITFPKWRNESIMGGGNAIVPQVAYEIFKAIQTMEDEHTRDI